MIFEAKLYFSFVSFLFQIGSKWFRRIAAICKARQRFWQRFGCGFTRTVSLNVQRNFPNALAHKSRQQINYLVGMWNEFIDYHYYNHRLEWNRSNCIPNHCRKWHRNWTKHVVKCLAHWLKHGATWLPKWKVEVKCIANFPPRWLKKSLNHWSKYWTISIKWEKR